VLKTASKDTLVREIMARDVITVKPTDSLDYCMELMTQNGLDIYRLLKTMWFFWASIGDVVKSIIEIQKETIQHLDSLYGTKHNYIWNYQSK
jgi:CBS domain-containing protein